MSREEHNEYMKDVKWTTGIAVLKYSLFSGGALLLAIAGAYYGLKGDISAGRNETREMFLAVNHKLDSVQHDNAIEFRDIWRDLKVLKVGDKKSTSFVTERYVDGELVLSKVKR